MRIARFGVRTDQPATARHMPCSDSDSRPANQGSQAQSLLSSARGTLPVHLATQYVVSRSIDEVEQQWHDSALIDGDLIDAVQRLKADRDIVVAGSISVAHALMQADLVDEYRLLVFPIVVGEGARLFEPGKCAELKLVNVDRAGAAALLTYRR